ncbi:MAG: DUF362 domain-containing protein [Candidatus Methylomirabilota bacterium]
MVGETTRREFLGYAGVIGGGLLQVGEGEMASASAGSAVVMAHTRDRRQGVRASLSALGINPVRGKEVLIKPNLNTADPAPGSTHNETLTALVEGLWEMGAKSISLGERSYQLTQEVMEQKGVLPLLERLDVRVIDFDRLDGKEWVLCKPRESHWADGFRVARPILESECLVYTCCLKTHRPLGVFTMALKLAVGAVPTTRHGFNYMRELHGSPHGRKMIAELNQPFAPALIVLDGVDAFVDGGPATGTPAQGNAVLASADRVAIDAVGVAILKHLGSNEKIMTPKIYEQEQIARAAALRIGAPSPAEIRLVAADAASREYRDKIDAILQQG